MKAPPDQPYNLPALQVALEKGGLIGRGVTLELTPYAPAFPRRPIHRRWHYRVDAQGKAICHLVVGQNLARVHTQAVDFYQACPELVCRPLLFCEQPDGIGHLCLEHFAGESLDDAVHHGRCNAGEWLRQVRRAQQFLERSQQPSNLAGLRREIQELIDETCSFPGFSSIDTRLLREMAEPVLNEDAPAGPLATRWSNGDFIGRNLLINAGGDLRLIDYEHAAPTHFGQSDWLRLTRFSTLPPGLDPDSIEEVALAQQPWQEVHLWLHNLSQLRQAESGGAVDRHIASVATQLFSAIERAAGQKPAGRKRSFLVTALIGQPGGGSAHAETVEKARSLEERLSTDLGQARYRLLTLIRELVQQDSVIRAVRGERDQARLNEAALEVEATRLRRHLDQAQQRIDQLLNQGEGGRRAASAERWLPPGLVNQGGISYGIDQTGNVRAVGGKLTLSGWIAGGPEAARGVRLRLDSGDIFDCQTGCPRPDVTATHPTRPGAATSGFTLHTYLPAGLHLGTLEYCAASAGNWMPAGTFSVLSEVSPLLLRLEIPIPPRCPAGPLQIHGWCFHPQGEIVSLSVRFGATIATLTHGIARPEVGKAHPWHQAARRSGYDGLLDLAPGRGDVVLAATLRNGTILQQFLARDVVVPDLALERATEDLIAPAPDFSPGPVPVCPLHEVLDFGQKGTIEPFLAGGWSDPDVGFRWAMGPKAQLRLRFDPKARPRQMRLVLVPFLVPGSVEGQRIQVDLPQGTVPNAVELRRNEPQELIFNLPVTATASDILNLQFGFPNAHRPKELGLSDDMRLLSVGFLQLTFS